MNNKNNTDHSDISPKLRKVGKLKSSHGIRGDIFFLIFSKDASWLQPNMKIYLPKNNSFEEKVIQKCKPHKDGAIITLEGINSRNDSDLLLSQEVWVSADLFVSEDKGNLYLIELENFEVVDAMLGMIGRIEGFSSNGMQDLLIVVNNDKSYEIPFVKEFIQEIDYKKRSIKTQLPEGLLDINYED